MFLIAIALLGIARGGSSARLAETTKAAHRLFNFDNVMFKENLLFESSALSATDCGGKCFDQDGCEVFTYVTNVPPAMCRGYTSVPSLGSPGSSHPGAKTWAYVDTPSLCGIQDADGWTVFQRRQNGAVDFYQPWVHYVSGFGNRAGDCWLGLETLHSLTSSGNWTLRIDLGDWEGNTAYATYTGFYITNSTDNYRLMFDDGSYSGDAGDDLSVHNGMGFSTYDMDITDFCVAAWHGAWWFNDCYDSHLNGEYKPSSSTSSWEGIIWYSWKGKNYSLKFVEMKIKRL